jgi:pilus assembly protein CpaE
MSEAPTTSTSVRSRTVLVAPADALAQTAAWAGTLAACEIVATTSVIADIARLAAQHRADLLVVDRGVSDEAVFALLDQARLAPALGVVVLARDSDQAFERRVLRAGALEVVGAALDGAASGTLTEALAELRRRRALGTPPVPAPPAAAPRRASVALGPVIAVISAKGGVGRSFVAANLASMLAKERRVALCDLDLQFSELSHWGTDRAPERTIDQLAAVVAAGEIQRADVETIAATRFGNVTLLPGARSPLDGAAWASERGSRALRLAGALRAWYEYVVIDDLPGFLEPVVGIARGASLLLVVTTAEVGAVRATKRYLELLDRYAPTPRVVVVNRANKGLSAKLVREALGAGERTVNIKEDRTFARRLVVEGLAASQQRGRGVTRSFGRLADLVVTATARGA